MINRAPCLRRTWQAQVHVLRLFDLNIRVKPRGAFSLDHLSALTSPMAVLQDPCDVLVEDARLLCGCGLKIAAVLRKHPALDIPMMGRFRLTATPIHQRKTSGEIP